MLFCKHYFSPLNTFMRKEKNPDPYLCITDPDPGGLKTCGSGSPTLVNNVRLGPVGERDHVPLVSLIGQEWVRYSVPRHYSTSYTINILNDVPFRWEERKPEAKS
jgi:hypothetical protein